LRCPGRDEFRADRLKAKNKISRKADSTPSPSLVSSAKDAKVRVFTEDNEGNERSHLGFAVVVNQWAKTTVDYALSSTEANAAMERTTPEATSRSFSRTPFIAFATFCKKTLTFAPLRLCVRFCFYRNQPVFIRVGVFQEFNA
jgi:hypothetical protein